MMRAACPPHTHALLAVSCPPCHMLIFVFIDVLHMPMHDGPNALLLRVGKSVDALFFPR